MGYREKIRLLNQLGSAHPFAVTEITILRGGERPRGTESRTKDPSQRPERRRGRVGESGSGGGVVEGGEGGREVGGSSQELLYKALELTDSVHHATLIMEE